MAHLTLIFRTRLPAVRGSRGTGLADAEPGRLAAGVQRMLSKMVGEGGHKMVSKYGDGS